MSVKLSSWAWHSTPDDVKGNKLIALLALADIADDEGVCRYSDDTSQAALATKARMSVSQFREVTRWLEESGYIVSTRANQTAPKTYRINMTADFRRSDSSGHTAGNQRSSAPVSGGHSSIDVFNVSNVAKKGSSPKGSRLKEDWKPSQEDLAYTAESAPSVNVNVEVENFVDYWVSKPGQGGVKLDWSRTWKTWVRRAHQRNVERGWVGTAAVSSRPAPDEVRERWLAERGITFEEYLERKDEPGWVASLRVVKRSA